MKNSDKQPAVIVEEITKSFRIPIDGSAGLKQSIVNAFKRKKGYRDFTPLKEVSFTVNRGDFFGIVGKNGSGKSTLLKTMAGIYSPEQGAVTVNGSLVPFIELGVGFNPELSGRENVYLNGALLGFSRKEISNMYDEIVEFAELGDFMEERLKNYSSGMQVRLAFSIAIKAKGDILLLDEVLAVGDSAFQQKCFDYFEQLKREKRTIILVTHDMGAVQRFCNRAMIISNGRIEKIGKPEEIADIYKRENIDAESTKEDKKVLIKAKLLTSKSLNPSEKIKFSVTYKLKHDVDHYIGLSFLYLGLSAAEKNNKHLPNPVAKNGWCTVEFEQSLSNFNAGNYDISIAIFRRDTEALIDYDLRVATFVVSGFDDTLGGPLRLDGEWNNIDSASRPE